MQSIFHKHWDTENASKIALEMVLAVFTLFYFLKFKTNYDPPVLSGDQTLNWIYYGS